MSWLKKEWASLGDAQVIIYAVGWFIAIPVVLNVIKYLVS